MSISKGIWSNFAKRSPSLSVKSSAIKQALLSPDLPGGPATLKKRSSRIKYDSPIGMDSIYPMAYEILEKQSEGFYEKIENLEQKLSKVQDFNEKSLLQNEIENLLIKSELYNPEVLFNSNYNLNSLDLTQPVYRYYLKKNWESHDRMLLMQRLESLHVIPDTLPTLDPKVDVKLKFPHNNVEKWISPGEILSSNVTLKPPMFKITEFEKINNDLYTVLIVNPDVPDLENDSFSTTLHWAISDIELSNVDNEINAAKLLSSENSELIEYIPPTPEKNAPINRLCIWVFKQTENKKLDTNTIAENIKREFFDIRKFVKEAHLQPIGAHVFRSQWDRNVNNVRKLYGLPEGRVFSNIRH
ncbi:hypothetical protein PACTADRAFT_57713 [Pachysolen tannophilus NRRL Y-2460]|uniref:Large ribosomal subunit protein mL38 n=1 Tax=Pachysolen tannophilus NRRL Y-2460 TaxID=669874 RepID=A0A1E4TTV6_PACTA|nr:hypothetical protein PACTADRAFT_57713 [Pachysolen tannophilus NRRL Y-2460]